MSDTPTFEIAAITAALNDIASHLECRCANCGRLLRRLRIDGGEVRDDEGPASSRSGRLREADPEHRTELNPTFLYPKQKSMTALPDGTIKAEPGRTGWMNERIKWACASRCGRVVERRADGLAADVVRASEAGMTVLHLDEAGQPAAYNGYAAPRRRRPT